MIITTTPNLSTFPSDRLHLVGLGHTASIPADEAPGLSSSACQPCDISIETSHGRLVCGVFLPRQFAGLIKRVVQSTILRSENLILRNLALPIRYHRVSSPPSN